ncbi:MAG: hypothetical protein WC609_01030 [Candidatus Paceibacterota bacterium]|jgi:hypothetical protein
MIEIKDLLGRFNKILLSEEGKKISIAGVVSAIIKTKVKPEQVEIKNNIIYLKIKPIYKNEIFLKKEQIFLELKTILGERAPGKIR